VRDRTPSDGAVLSLQLDANNPKTGLSARFEATYTADVGLLFEPTEAAMSRPVDGRKCAVSGRNIRVDDVCPALSTALGWN
jgi:hypothetical protein